MKPAFALLLSVDKITLLHRADQGWLRVGDVFASDPDLTAVLATLLEKATLLELDTRCKVVLPDDQIRYLTIDTGSASVDERQVLIESELESATPYRLNDLVFDAAEEGTVTHVAAVAKVTLSEAEAFARKHQFQPVSYVALPKPDMFPHEPFFGAALGFDEPIEPDDDRIEIVGEASIPQFEISSDALSQNREISVPLVQGPVGPATGRQDTVGFTSCRRPNLPEVEQENTGNSAEPTPTKPVEKPHTTKLQRPHQPTIHPIADSAPAAVFQAPIVPKSPPNEAERLTIFGARNSGRKNRLLTITAIAASMFVVTGLAGWLVVGTSTGPDAVPDLQNPPLEVSERFNPADPDEGPHVVVDQGIPETAGTPVLSVTDSAVLDALRVEPQSVDVVDVNPEVEDSLYAESGVWSDDPLPPLDPEIDTSLNDLYVASIDTADLSQDAIALPDADSFNTDYPLGQVSLPGTAGAKFELDSRGLVTATPEGTLNPDGVIIYLGRPSTVPPPPPERTESKPEIDETLVRLGGFKPKLRPDTLVENSERQQLGGRSVEELAGLRPKLRPESLQTDPTIDNAPTALAVVVALKPKIRPKGLAPVTASVSAATNSTLGASGGQDSSASSEEAGSFAAISVTPKIPSTASVARQATLDNALNLRRLNLIGVYGTPANRRALIRLPSGRYKKVKVGDRIDGGKIVAIGDSELHYQKNGRKVTLDMPKG